MAVIAGMSSATAGREISPAMKAPKTKRRGDEPAPLYYPDPDGPRQLVAVGAEQAKQHQEKVDEVEVERQRAHHRLAAGNRAVVVGRVHRLDLLRVVGGKPG